MRSLALLTAVAAAAVALPSGAVAVPAAGTSGAACDTRRVQTLTMTLPTSPPKSYKAGRGLTLRLSVKRGTLAAQDVNVSLILRGKGWFGYGEGMTDTTGAASVVIKVPASARGAGLLTADTYKFLVAIPCANIEEFDLVERAWGSAVK